MVAMESIWFQPAPKHWEFLHATEIDLPLHGLKSLLPFMQASLYGQISVNTFSAVTEIETTFCKPLKLVYLCTVSSACFQSIQVLPYGRVFTSQIQSYWHIGIQQGCRVRGNGLGKAVGLRALAPNALERGSAAKLLGITMRR